MAKCDTFSSANKQKVEVFVREFRKETTTNLYHTLFTNIGHQRKSRNSIVQRRWMVSYLVCLCDVRVVYVISHFAKAPGKTVKCVSPRMGPLRMIRLSCILDSFVNGFVDSLIRLMWIWKHKRSKGEDNDTLLNNERLDTESCVLLVLRWKWEYCLLREFVGSNSPNLAWDWVVRMEFFILRQGWFEV